MGGFELKIELLSSVHMTTPPSVRGMRLRASLRGHSRFIADVSWSPDGRHLASVSDDQSVRVWDIIHGEVAKIGFSGSATRLQWSPNGAFIVWASGRKVSIARPDGTEIRDFDAEAVPGVWNVRAVAWSPDSNQLACALGDVYIWNITTGKHTKLKGHGNWITAVAWSSDGKLLACGEMSPDISRNTLRVWDVKTRTEKIVMKSSSVNALAWLDSDAQLAAGCDDGAIRIWNPSTGDLARSLEGNVGQVWSVSAANDKKVLASRAGRATLWRSDNWEVIASLGSEAADGPVSLNSDCSLLATVVNHCGTILVWEMDIESLLATAASEMIHYTTARIALVGDSGVGKTGLGWRIATGQYKEHTSTHGQQFWVVDALGLKRSDGTECEAVLWDFAGQPDYRIIHALLLDDVDLALVLFDPANRYEPMKGVEYWLEQLRRREGRACCSILVGSRVDRGAAMMTNAELESFCNSNRVEGGYLATSALTGEGIDRLFDRIRRRIDWEAMTATVTTSTFKRIKEHVLQLKSTPAGNSVVVEPSELRQSLIDTDPGWEFSDEEMMTAVKNLSKHGYVAVLKGSSGIERILLTPDILTNLAASFVLEARRNAKGLGALIEEQVLSGGYCFQELVSLAEDQREVLLDAATSRFIQHNLCFRETIGPSVLLIFPSLINLKRPLMEIIPTEDDVSYVVSGPTENVYATLVVLLGYTNTFTRTNQWQNQAEYEMGPGEVCGFRQVEEREGETEFVLYYGKNTPSHTRLTFQGLFEKFLRTRDLSVRRFPPVQCPKCGYMQQRAAIAMRVRQGKSHTFCIECGSSIKLSSEVAELALPSRERRALATEQARARFRTTFEAALVVLKRITRDRKNPTCFVSYAWGRPEHEKFVAVLCDDLRKGEVDPIFDKRDNSWIGEDIALFISKMESSDFISVIGTPQYRQKYLDGDTIVAAEVNLINQRYIGDAESKRTVLPILLEGEWQQSFPPLMKGKTFADFRQDHLYFSVLLDLILSIHRINLEHEGFSQMRKDLRGVL